MAVPRSLSRWFRLPGRLALILGVGALSSAGAARVDTPEGHQRASPGDVLIRSESGRIYFSEGGRETELQLTATPQRDRLLRLLEEHGPTGIKLDPDPRLIMSGGGGTGFSLRDIAKSVTGDPAPASQDRPQATPPRSPPEQGSAPRDHTRPTSKKG